MERYRGSALGILWTAVIPLLRLSVYTFVFSILLGGREAIWGLESNFEVGLMIFSGLIIFTVFSDTLGRSPRLIWLNKTYVKHLVFPIEILPVCITGAAVVHSVVGAVILLIMKLIFTGNLEWTSFYLPLVYAPLIPFTVGVSWLFATIGAFWRDMASSNGYCA
ncbi:MAG: ABC transporter permease [Deltaproteobacteria bacterium]|nr:ABC transporter permease [Deltaproteobacteria bacterium]